MKKRINSRSSKRAKEEDEYKKIKELKRKFMIENKHFNCIFCNTKLNPVEEIGWHHITGRTAKDLIEWHNIFPAHDLCHSDFHHKDVTSLLKTTWYSHFVTRLENLKTKYGNRAYNAELARMNKAEKMDNETYFRLMK